MGKSFTEQGPAPDTGKGQQLDCLPLQVLLSFKLRVLNAY
jgi:hypothetical protein